MPSRHRVFDHFCRYLTDLEADSTPRSWVLNGYGKTEIVTNQQYLTDNFSPREETILQYGNLIHIEHIPSKDGDGNTNGKLPDWAGIILPDRAFPFGRVRFNAYSLEGLLSFRPMPLTHIEGTPRQMFTLIIQYANEAAGRAGLANNIPIQLGTLDDLPLKLSDDLSQSALTHIQKLVSNAGMDWDITTEIDGKGNLQVYANLYTRKGSDTSLILNNLNTQRDENDQGVVEQGTPFNVVFGFSQANTKESRFGPLMGINQGAYDDYGFLGTNTVFTGTHDAASVANAAQSLADAIGRPRKIIPKRFVLDIGDTFSYLNTGNTVALQETNAGFAPGGGFGMVESRARILSLDYNDLSNNAPVNWEIT